MTAHRGSKYIFGGIRSINDIVHNRQAFEIHHFQPLLFVIDSFDHLYGEVDRLEKWLLEGKLDNVAPCEPTVDEADLASFLERT